MNANFFHLISFISCQENSAHESKFSSQNTAFIYYVHVTTIIVCEYFICYGNSSSYTCQVAIIMFIICYILSEDN